MTNWQMVELLPDMYVNLCKEKEDYAFSIGRQAYRNSKSIGEAIQWMTHENDTILNFRYLLTNHEKYCDNLLL